MSEVDEFYEHEVRGSGRSRKRNRNAMRQRILENFYRRKLGELSVARFEWQGLPETIDRRFLELTLYSTGLAVCFRDERFDKVLALPATRSRCDAQDNPVAFTPVGHNGALFPEVAARKCAPIWANDWRTPDLDIVKIYAQRFAELDRSIEINSANAHRSKLVVASESRRLTMANIENQISAGAQTVYVTDDFAAGMGGEDIRVLDLQINPDHIEQLHILKVRQWNECMMMLGIDGANQDKKERLVSSEVDANVEQINLNKAVALRSRQEACVRMNALFDLSVSVDYSRRFAGVGFNTVFGGGE